MLAPAPTGSRTTGTRASSAAVQAGAIAARYSEATVPRLMTTPLEMASSSAISSTAWLMMGEAPKASRALAVVLVTT